MKKSHGTYFGTASSLQKNVMTLFFGIWLSLPAIQQMMGMLFMFPSSFTKTCRRPIMSTTLLLLLNQLCFLLFCGRQLCTAAYQDGDNSVLSHLSKLPTLNFEIPHTQFQEKNEFSSNLQSEAKSPYSIPRSLRQANIEAQKLSIAVKDAEKFSIGSFPENGFGASVLEKAEKGSEVAPTASSNKIAAKTSNKVYISDESVYQWDYTMKGRNWNVGQCKSGKHQSPIDLSVPGLRIGKHSTIVESYVEALKQLNNDSKFYKKLKTWKKGDFFYNYASYPDSIYLRKSNKHFQLKSTSQQPFGTIVPTDSHQLYFADQILFHSPSEHTFQGSGNRRQIEMQIWHSSSGSVRKSPSDTAQESSQPYLGQFIENILYNEYQREKVTTDNEDWRVLSLTFMSGELPQTTEKEVNDLPSEKLIKALVEASISASTKNSSVETKITLTHPLNLPSLLLMLQLSSLDFFQYSGSKTVPPCDENVKWYIAVNPLPVSTETMLRFYKIVNSNNFPSDSMEDGNFRELQRNIPNSSNPTVVRITQGFPIQLLIQETLVNA
ncbi:hypothetical protein IE077_002423 [Cardiosporidium cionae]|uniref:Alpha-carbonic anhydrase domain-containing protein n=1 Tax=Cardiosporidium cionae TaxID=476202 RepID=A0ABQ7JAW8_9APIC|nr:hypothetical protein IE077_002423 [Cardiosporidium cionae]|eukprot:KAF8821143.1 hypothetical protein IE077_002423 [Cardiosporidium cionae]